VRKRVALAEERLSEMETIAGTPKGNAERVVKLVAEYEKQRAKAERLADGLNITELYDHIAERLIWHSTVLTDVRAKVPEQAHFGIDAAIERSGVGAEKAIERLRQSNIRSGVPTGELEEREGEKRIGELEERLEQAHAAALVGAGPP